MKIMAEYMSSGNAPAEEGGKFPVLEREDGARYVGRIGQELPELRKEAAERGFADRE